MSRATIWIFSLYALSVVGCAVFEESTGPKPSLGPQEKVYYGTFEEVWRATALALQSPTAYPLRVNNMDTGVIETEVLKGAQAWLPPHRQEPMSGGYNYKLYIRVIKGNIGARQAYKVSVQKEAQIQRDFFSEPEPIASDGLEEKVILYRIEREIAIERALKKVQKRSATDT